MITNDLVLAVDPSPKCSSSEIEAVWARCSAADPSHAYLLKYRLPRLSLRQIGDYLVAPLHNLRGELIGLRLVDAHGTEDVWPKSAADAPFLIQRETPESTIIVRGTLADAMSIYAGCKSRVLHVPLHADAGQLREELLVGRFGREVLIAEPSAAYANAAGQIGERLQQTVVPPLGLSWSQLYESLGAAGIRSWIEDPVLLFGGVTPPRDFVVRASGVWACPPDGAPSIRISGPASAVALAHDADQDHWRRVIYVQDRDGRDRMLLIAEPQLLLSSRQALARLVDAGLEIADTEAARFLISNLARTEVTRRLVVVNRGGWHGEHYVGPAGTIGPNRNALPVQNGQFGLAAPPSPARLDAWKCDIGTLVEGNSRLVLALGVAFGGIAIGLLGGQASFGVHLRGHSSIGKSTALRVAASVYGAPQDQVRSWSSTENGLEALAARHHHRALFLDELAQIAPAAAAQAGYLIGNGLGRERAGSTGRALPTQTWELTFLSSGEIALEDKIAERSGAPTMRDGQAVRLVDLPADAGHGHGLFETLHGHVSGAALSEHLSRATQACRGDIAQVFAAALAEDVERSRHLLIGARAQFVDAHLPDGANGIVGRVYANLGFLAAACEVATRFGILPWGEESGIAGIAVCARDWCASRTKVRDRSLVDTAREWIVRNADGLSQWETGFAADERRGYIRRAPLAFYLLPAGWRDLCREVGSVPMQAELTAAGFFRRAPARLPGAKLAKFYIIDGDILTASVRGGNKGNKSQG